MNNSKNIPYFPTIPAFLVLLVCIKSKKIKSTNAEKDHKNYNTSYAIDINQHISTIKKKPTRKKKEHSLAIFFNVKIKTPKERNAFNLELDNFQG